ncbi:glycoside hydrolase family 43 protein [Enterococcus sp. LJL90]
MQKRTKIIWGSLIAVTLLTGCSIAQGVESIEQKAWTTHPQEKVSIHDPSIETVENQDGKTTYYLFGSHLGQAKSDDLLSWDVPFTTEYENMEDNIIYGNVAENLAETFEWAGYDDADSAGGYSLWAPDIIWNEAYEWPDGETGAFMLYYSASSTWRRSAIGFAVAKTIEGPYSYADTIMYSGFTEKDSTDGSERNTNYQNTNLKQLMDDDIIEDFNSEWAIEEGLTYNTDYAPNAIDPTLFFDENNQLWMTYGSWSGGIFILEMDAATGRPIYPGTDSKTSDGRMIDRYFGTKLSGGFHQSGEGPYILYDKDTDYYYLFVTYGGLSAKGGYNMRLFRSQNPDGPYTDAKGNSPIIAAGELNDQYGIKLMGNYQFSNQAVGYRAGGHNSALIDEDGQWYLIYHSRFNNGGENHEVQVHQMVMNEAGWPVPLPYAYSGEPLELKNLSEAEIVGSYEFINHGTDSGKTMLDTLAISLNADGTISGDVSGEWQQGNQGSVTIHLKNATYSGHFVEQQLEDNSGTVLTFSAIGTNNETIWGSKLA